MNDQSVGTNYEYRVNTSFSDYIFALLLFCPLALYYFLPSSYEARLSLNLWGGRMFLPEVLFFIAPCFYRRASQTNISKLRQVLVASCIVCFIYSFTLLLRPGVDSPQSRILMSGEAFLFPIIPLLFPFTERHDKPLRLIVLSCVLLLGVEVFLYSLGILQWKVDLGDQAFGNVSRINTTIGAATGSGLVLFMLGAWSGDLWRHRKWVLMASIVISFVSITMLLSRGSILMMFFAAVLIISCRIYLYRYKVSEHMKLVGAVVVLALAIGFIGTKYGVFESVEGRIANLQDQGEDGRIVRYRAALETAYENPIFGVGPGCYFITKRFKGGEIRGLGAPHNYYLTVIAEYGIPLAMFFLVPLILSVAVVLFRSPLSIASAGLIAIAIVGMNVEGVFVEVEFGLLFFMILSSLIYKTREQVGWHEG